MRNTILSWRDNKIRWVLLFYVLGTIIGAYLMFFHELLFITPVMARFKVLTTVLYVPLLVVVISVLAAVARQRRRRE